jgi:hypothetical protein
MSIKGGERDCASEVCLLALGDRVACVVKMLFRKPEVYYIYVLIILGEHEV